MSQEEILNQLIDCFDVGVDEDGDEYSSCKHPERAWSLVCDLANRLNMDNAKPDPIPPPIEFAEHDGTLRKIVWDAGDESVGVYPGYNAEDEPSTPSIPTGPATGPELRDRVKAKFKEALGDTLEGWGNEDSRADAYTDELLALIPAQPLDLKEKDMTDKPKHIPYTYRGRSVCSQCGIILPASKPCPGRIEITLHKEEGSAKSGPTALEEESAPVCEYCGVPEVLAPAIGYYCGNKDCPDAQGTEEEQTTKRLERALKFFTSPEPLKADTIPSGSPKGEPSNPIPDLEATGVAVKAAQAEPGSKAPAGSNPAPSTSEIPNTSDHKGREWDELQERLKEAQDLSEHYLKGLREAQGMAEAFWKARTEAAEARVRDLEGALRFYAEEAIYDENGCPMMKLTNILGQEITEADFGDTARAALGTHRGEGG